MWDGAGAAPYNNVIGLDPQLTDPQHGDFRLQPGSPATGYGCQTFGPRRPERPVPPAAPTSAPLRRRAEIDVAGSISLDTLWNVDTVHVVGNVTVEDGATLVIAPGVRVEFQDYYSLAIAGQLIATGTPDAGILFTTDEPWAFRVDGSQVGCWNGVRFDRTKATNPASQLAYCTIEYSKATGPGYGTYPYGGGAISIVDFSKLAIENCIFRRNVADYGGAMFLYEGASPRIVSNLIVDNHALQNAAAIYCAYSYPLLVNNTMVGNWIHNAENPYIESCAVLNFLGKPLLANNIVRDNKPDVVYMHSQLWQTKAYYMRHNNIQDGPASGGNIDADPLFVDPDHGDYHLAPDSPCVDAGASLLVPIGALDLDGQPRVARFIVDMGAYEVPFGDLNCDRRVDFDDIHAFVLALSDPTAYAAQYPTCDVRNADCNGDAAVDFDDIDPFVQLIGTPRL